MCLETDLKGLCFDVDYDPVSNRSCDDRSLTVGWQDEHRNTHDRVTHEPGFHARVRFRGRKADGSRLTVKEVHRSLFYAYTDYWRHGMRAGGTADRVGRLWNHRDACYAEQKPVTPTPDGLFIKKMAMEAQAKHTESSTSFSLPPNCFGADDVLPITPLPHFLNLWHILGMTGPGS